MPTDDSELKIAVCDDEENNREQIACMTEEILHEAGIAHSISVYENGRDLFAAVQGGEQYHLLLLDVMMDEMGGMELAVALRAQQDKTAIVFISSNREMALRGYEVSAVRYLAKPLEREKMKEALLYCFKDRQEKKEILLPTEQGQHRISFSDVQYVEAYERGTRFYLNNEILNTRIKISEVEAILPKSSFVLCHRAYIVNFAYVKRTRQYEFELKNGAVVPISKHRYYDVNKKFLDYIAD